VERSEFICLEADAFNHFEETKVLPIELFRWLHGGNIGGIQPNQIAGFELDGFVLGVVVFGLKILCMFDVLYEAFVNFVEVGWEFFSSGSSVR